MEITYSIIIVFIVTVIILIFLLLNYLKQKILFYPKKKYAWIPDIPYQSFKLDPDGVTGWAFMNHPGSKTIVQFHGNSGNIGSNDHIIKLANMQKVNLVVFDYNGFGKSEGIPSQEMVYKNSLDVYDYVVDKLHVDPFDIILWGESLGGAAAVYVAEKRKCSSLVLVSTFSNIQDVMSIKFTNPIIRFISYLLPSCVDIMPNSFRLKNVTSPVIIIHSTEDDIIPYECAKRNYDEIPHSVKKLITVSGEHASPKISKDQLREIFQFICSDDTNISKATPLLREIHEIKNRYFVDSLSQRIDR